MENRTADSVFETDERSIRRMRVFFWIVAICGPLAFLWLAFRDEELSTAAIVFVAAAGVMLLSGFRTVIGIRLYEDRLRIITPLSEFDIRWEDVTVVYCGFFRWDLYLRGRLWPYTYMAFTRSQKTAASIIRQHAGRC